jgi:hypothetical protein
MATKDDATPAPKPVTQYVLSADDLRLLLSGFVEASKSMASTPTTDAMTALLKQVESLTQTAQRSIRHENPNYEDRSVFTVDPNCDICKAGGLHFIENDPIGKYAHPRPAMKYEFEFCQGLVRAEWLTIPEIELVNKFDCDKSSRHGTWTATISRQGTKQRLVVDVPYRGLDTRVELPSQSAILVELLYGETIADPASAILIVQQLQKKVEELEARLATGAHA